VVSGDRDRIPVRNLVRAETEHLGDHRQARLRRRCKCRERCIP
jgi:hypothetical protein